MEFRPEYLEHILDHGLVCSTLLSVNWSVMTEHRV